MRKLLVIIIVLVSTLGPYLIYKFRCDLTGSEILTLVGLIIGLLYYSVTKIIEEARRSEEKIFEQIKNNYQRAFSLIENSNLNHRWVAARLLIIKTMKLSNKLKNSGVKESYLLEEQYYNSLFYDLLKKIPSYRYFFGLPKEQYENMKNSDKKLYELTNGYISKSTKLGERRSEKNIYSHIDIITLFSFLRFIFKDEKENGEKICCDISPKSSKVFCYFSDKNISELKKLCRCYLFKRGKLLEKWLLVKICFMCHSNYKKTILNDRELFSLRLFLSRNNKENLLIKLCLIGDVNSTEVITFDQFGTVMSYYDVLKKFKAMSLDEFSPIRLCSEKITEY